MKILEIIPALGYGGAEILLLNICAGLKRKAPSLDITVLVLSELNDLTPKFEENGITVKHLSLSKLSFIQKILTVKKQIKAINPDLIHSHLLLADRYGLLGGFLAGVKKRFTTAHNMESQRSFQDKLTRFITSLFAKKIVAVSKSAKQFYIDEHVYPGKKLHVIYNAPGFINENPTPKSAPTETIKIISVGKLSPQKGHIYLIKAIKLLKDLPVEVKIFGAEFDDYRHTLRKALDETGLKNISIMGPTSNVKEELNKADLFIAPSLWEGMPLAQMEALMMGVPLIASDIDPHKELLAMVCDDYPLITKTKDPESIAEAIRRVINSKNLYEELSKKSIEASNLFSQEALVNNYYKLLIK